ncbi:MAG: hypothetical protein K1Y36_17675 [Blastocatellia bacterium]|nr:hypothetical protein [Blastocatellia bacterium]
MLLDTFLPQADFQEFHAIRIHSPAEKVFQSIKNVTITELPLTRTLMRIRMLPARLSGDRSRFLAIDRPLVSWAANSGLILAEDAGHEMVFGIIGQFWKASGGLLATPPGIGEFLAFQQAGFAKAATNFYLSEGTGANETRLSTETRIQALDGATRRKFGWYWRLIQPGSAFIRREWLNAVKKRAESEK